MARSVVFFDPPGAWFAYVWDDEARGRLPCTCPDAAMRYVQVESEEAGIRWCDRNEHDVVIGYRARCAYDAGSPTVKPEWLPYYRKFAEAEAEINAIVEQLEREEREREQAR
jgi:hypothetical protein